MASVLRDFVPKLRSYMDVPVRLDALQLAFPRGMIDRTKARAFFANHPNFSGWRFRRRWDIVIVQGELLHEQADVAEFLRYFATILISQGVLIHHPSEITVYDTSLDMDLLFTQVSISRIESAFDLRPEQIVLPPHLAQRIKEWSLYSRDHLPGRHGSSLILYDVKRKYLEKGRTPYTFTGDLERPLRLEFRLYGIRCPYLHLGNLGGTSIDIIERFESYLSNLWWRLKFSHGLNLPNSFALQNLSPEHEILKSITGYHFSNRDNGLLPKPDWKDGVYHRVVKLSELVPLPTSVTSQARSLLNMSKRNRAISRMILVDREKSIERLRNRILS